MVIAELTQKYPNYDFFSFAGERPKTDTEVLLNCKAGFISKEYNGQWRDYLGINMSKESYNSLLSLFNEDNSVVGFTTKNIPFKGVKRGEFIFSVCLVTSERVCFYCH